ncbi:jg19215 [Pararge aegeria aegeria]|uniref:Jg19215 protein n=1 Tax=Pararge aegeria aegeria TaxID=348720 RepID=A0A8S4SJ85_9NEOP|nr:jg19215 [Pararge aegeria aegeria]
MEVAQIWEVMSLRTIELETKIPTDRSKKIELNYREDLEDLRLLVAKEYCIIISGGEEYTKYHHMDKEKKQSMSKKEATLFETIICISIQIVWIALGRKYYNQIELEINRMLKSDIYNSAEHKRDTKYLSKMNPRERLVLVGHCMHVGKKLNTRSPLMNEVFCDRNIGFRLYGLGALQYSRLNTRLRYLESILSDPEHTFGNVGITLGIIGIQRAKFDIMLRELSMAASTSGSSSSIRQSISRSSRVSRVSRVMSRRSTVTAVPKKLYPDICIPEKGPESLPDQFPRKMLPKLSSNNEQRLKWLRRVASKRKKPRR